MSKKGVFRLFCPFLHNGYDNLPDFLQECRRHKGTLFEQDVFSEKIINLGL